MRRASAMITHNRVRACHVDAVGKERGGAGVSVLEEQHGGPGQQRAALQNTAPAHHPTPHLALLQPL